MRQGSGAEWKRRRLAGAELRERLERAFEEYGEPLENVTVLRYLGRVLTARYDDWLAVVGNIGKSRKSWGRLSGILIREGADPKVSVNFHKAVAQAVLLSGAETWVLTPRMEQALDSFKHRVAQWITGRQPRIRGGGSWYYPSLEEATGGVGFKGIRKSVMTRQNTVARYIATLPILDLCEQSTRRPGARVSWRWWEQAGINLEGANNKAAEAETVLESELYSDSNSDPGREEGSMGASWSSGAERSGVEWSG